MLSGGFERVETSMRVSSSRVISSMVSVGINCGGAQSVKSRAPARRHGATAARTSCNSSGGNRLRKLKCATATSNGPCRSSRAFRCRRSAQTRRMRDDHVDCLSRRRAIAIIRLLASTPVGENRAAAHGSRYLPVPHPRSSNRGTTECGGLGNFAHCRSRMLHWRTASSASTSTYSRS